MNIKANITEAEDPALNGETFHKGAFAFSPNFPIIECLDDVLPHIRPDEGIKTHAWGKDFVGVNYAVTMPETFQTALDLECRGLIFDRRTGALLSRPLHKTFQIGERQSLLDLDLQSGNWIEKKLDGSMIAGLVAPGPARKVMLHTRGGFSRQARAALQIAPRSTLAMVRDTFDAGYTPVFEWTSPENRVVIKYRENRLTLLALRHRRTGKYLHRSDMEAWARDYDTPCVPVYGASLASIDDLKHLIEEVRALQGEEGVMVVFPSGHRIKVKASEYLLHHKIISDIASEKNAQKAWIENAIDDIAVILDDHRGRTLRQFGADMDRIMLNAVARVEDVISQADHLAPRDRAAKIQASLPKPLASAGFALIKGQDGMDQMRRILSWGHRSLANMDVVRQTFDLPRWAPDDA